MSIREKDTEAQYSGRASSEDANHVAGHDGALNVAKAVEDVTPATGTAPEKEDRETRRIMRKIDRRLLPPLAIIYAFALIDRGNLPNARISGMEDDLGLDIGSRYSLLTMVFFIPYMILQLPGNIIIRQLGPAMWLPSLVVAWGAVTIGMCFVTDWTQALGCRIILGALEAGYYPGCLYLLSCWYVRFEIQKRFSAFYLNALLAAGLSNILAFGITEMKGLGGLNAWQWIFSIEGAITVLLGFMGYVAIIDFPDKATKPNLITRRPFLTEAEVTIVLARIQRDRGDAIADKLTVATIIVHLRDWKIWEFAWLYFLNNVVSYSFGYFLPVILNSGMGKSVAMSQVLSFPPYVVAAVWMFCTAWVADRYRKRGAIIILNCSVAIIGVCMMAYVKNPDVRYAGVFLGVTGANSNVPSLLSYMHNNIVGQMKRSVASALLIGGGACGGITAANIFRQQDKPDYHPAMATVIATQVLTILHILKNFVVYTRANRNADRGERILEGQEGFRQTL